MSERSNKTIAKIGWGLLGFTLLCYFLVALIATLQGDGGFGVSHSFSGKPSFFIPAAVLPAFFIAFAIGIYWLIKRVKNKRKQPNLTVERDASRHSRSRPSP
ncbi:MAG: YpbF family protein [Gammaproteobacteria bacterium]|nr:YpbF family protein [Gammaproteobacteria bacterium]MBU1480472.1 YpbF family protein [Gammaproteobacteria bacterium]